jgi:hypothetical protein
VVKRKKGLQRRYLEEEERGNGFKISIEVVVKYTIFFFSILTHISVLDNTFFLYFVLYFFLPLTSLFCELDGWEFRLEWGSRSRVHVIENGGEEQVYEERKRDGSGSLSRTEKAIPKWFLEMWGRRKKKGALLSFHTKLKSMRATWSF